MKDRRRAGRESVAVDLAFGQHEDRTLTWLRGDARGRDGGVREELVAGAALRSESPLSGKLDIE
jgi:hypothetical protein